MAADATSPGPSITRSRWFRALPILVGVAVGIGIAVWQTAGTDPATALELGTCFQLPDDEDDEFERVATRTCSEPHEAQVVGVTRQVVPGSIDAACEFSVEWWMDPTKITDQLQLRPFELTRAGIDEYLCVAANDDRSPLVGSLQRP